MNTLYQEMNEDLKLPVVLAAVCPKEATLLLLGYLRKLFDFWNVHGIMNTSGYFA